MPLQTCRRHPSAGRFMATCSGCARELYNMEQRNRALAAAEQALTTLGTLTGTKVIDAAWVRGALVVTSHQPNSQAFEYAIDSFRLPTPDETDTDQDEPRAPGEWILVDQYGGHSADEVPGMVADATAYLHTLFPVRELAA